MRNLLINSWHSNQAQTMPFPSGEVLLERLKPAAELTNQRLARLVLRLRARFPVSVPLRADADAATLIAWLTEAGAVVGVSTPHPALTASSAQPLFAATSASAASSASQESDDRTK